MNNKKVLSIAAIVLVSSVIAFLAISKLSVDSSQTLSATITEANAETGEFTVITDNALDSSFASAKTTPLKEFQCIHGDCAVPQDERFKVGDRVEAVITASTTPPFPLIGDGVWTVEFYVASASRP